MLSAYQILSRHIKRLAVAGGQHRGAHQSARGAAAATAAAAGASAAPRQRVSRRDAHMSLLPLGQAHLLDGIQHILVGHVNLFAIMCSEALQVAAFTLLWEKT